MRHLKPNHRGKRSTKPAMRNWLELPPEITANILHRLGAVDILKGAQMVCTAWHNICKDPAMWRVIDMCNSEDMCNMTVDLEKMCKHAVDRSDELLDYIVERSSQLKRLTVSCCYVCVHEGLNAAVKKLPLLEELHLNYTYISKEAIADAGRFCPRLKSFKLNVRWFRHPVEDPDLEEVESNNEAFAVAENMHHLRHLELIGNQITDMGLTAILDGCPQLESLDVRCCRNLKLKGSLGKRCLEQIKEFKRPNESVQDCKFMFDEKSDDGYFSDVDVLPRFQYDDMLSSDDDDDDDDDDDVEDEDDDDDDEVDEDDDDDDEVDDDDDDVEEVDSDDW